jgi:outer membrane protein OmpA-like peptidoglycan-associated protein
MRIKNSHVWLLLCLLAGVIFVLVKLYTTSPRERVILLPQPDGTPSAVIVQSKSGATAVLDRPYSVATVTPKQLGSEQTDEANVKTRYKDLFDALPARPRAYQLYFETGGTRLTPESQKLLQLIVGVLSDIKDLPAFELTVIGHADEVGTDALNDELSRRRAATIVSMLKAKGIDTGRASIVGRGSRDPLIPTKKGTAEVKNRRVEIRLK